MGSPSDSQGRQTPYVSRGASDVVDVEGGGCMAGAALCVPWWLVEDVEEAVARRISSTSSLVNVSAVGGRRSMVCGKEEKTCHGASV